MLILVDVDQFLLVHRISRSSSISNLYVRNVRNYTFVPRELFNMIQLEYMFFSASEAPSALNNVNVKCRTNIRNLNDKLMTRKMCGSYVSKLRDYLNGGKWTYGISA